MINPPELPINDLARNDAHISAHQGLLHQKKKPEISDASKRQLNQAS